MDDNRASTDKSVRSQQMIALGIIVVLVAAGGWLAFRTFHVPTPDEPIVDVSRGRGFGGMNFRIGGNNNAAPVRRQAVRKTGSTTKPAFDIHAEDSVMHAALNAQGSWQLTFRYQPAKYPAPAERKLLGAKYQSSTLKLTEDQQKQLSALPAPPVMVVADDDRAKILDLWTSYNAADDAGKTQKEPELLKKLAEISTKSEKASEEAMNEHVAKIKAILKPDQIEKLTGK